MKLTILGATGSIGASTVDLVLRHPERFCVHALVGHKNWQRMASLVKQVRPECVVMTDESAARQLKASLPAEVRLHVGMDAAIAAASESSVDMVMAAMVGSVGLPAALAAVRAGKRVGLANKECLVTAGQIFMADAIDFGADIVPVDSEHAAVHQALKGHDYHSIRRMILTASGGPFRKTRLEDLQKVTPAQAIAHPNWDMGAKISVDSATMMNKALELIEARWLFDMAPEKLHAVIHPQSIIHAMVEYEDGSVLAQLAEPDMRIPIAYALMPETRIASGANWLDLSISRSLDLIPIDEERFPALRLVREVMRGGHDLAVVMNAANEVANQAFRDEKIAFMQIVATVEKVLEQVPTMAVDTLDSIMLCDAEARRVAQRIIGL
ncbi:MAG: 1-deoxy-D-xylulose-5-phosphate reductoisomerase [Zetaproteobacteria bacterium]|nr:1-deoxy-D-xylulose-5-phosphate reductoisomerase [Zetaproteobacteria bacterium]